MTGLRFSVPGKPQPQGSKRLGRHGARYVILDANDAALRPWRGALTGFALAARGTTATLTGPVALTVTFTLPRPKSLPRSRTLPAVRPDLSKLLRAVEDALTDAAVYRDDAQICRLTVDKQYAGAAGRDAPGVEIEVTPL
jgi:Holliday junction resolvase RusA-like endonuclease